MWILSLNRCRQFFYTYDLEENVNLRLYIIHILIMTFEVFVTKIYYQRTRQIIKISFKIFMI